jgi:hypothetical protein
VPIVRKSWGLKILEILSICPGQFRDCFTHFLPSLLFLHPAVIVTPASVSIFLTSSLEISDSSTCSRVAPYARWLPVQRIPFSASLLASFSLYIPNFHHTVLLIVSLRTAASPWLLQRTIIQCQRSFLSHTTLHTSSVNTDTHSACLQTPRSVFLSYSQILSMPGVQTFSKLLAPQGWYKAGCTLGIHKYEEPPYKFGRLVFVHLQTYVSLSASIFHSFYPDVLPPPPSHLLTPLC